jgi:hypothetical protein
MCLNVVFGSKTPEKYFALLFIANNFALEKFLKPASLSS